LEAIGAEDYPRRSISGHGAEDSFHVPRLMADLRMGKSDRHEPGRAVVVVADRVTGLLDSGSVVAQAVGLDHQPQIGPEEVDSVAVHVGLGPGLWQAGAPGDRQEQALQLGVGEGEGGRVEDLAEERNAGLALEVIQGVPEGSQGRSGRACRPG
jgi:hypothetical protein